MIIITTGKVLCLSVAIVFLFLFRGYGNADTRTEELILVPRDAQPGDHFGGAVLYASNQFLVGASMDSNEKGDNAGAVYIFSSTGVQKDKLLPPETDAGGIQFGSAIHREGSTIVIGAPEATNGGIVYLFRWDTARGRWSYLHSITGSDTDDGHNFGTSVFKSGNSIFVGAPGDSINQGAVYAFELNASGSWTQVARLTGSTGGPGDNFGNSIAVSANRMLVGAPDATLSGSAYVFLYDEETGWHETARLGAPDTRRFGWSVALNGSTAVIGAPWTPSRPENGLGGSVYIFQKSGDAWTQVQSIVDSPRDALDRVLSASLNEIA